MLFVGLVHFRSRRLADRSHHGVQGMSTSAVVECRAISKSYGDGSSVEAVLRDVSLSFPRGETCVLLGPSGSGKTTLLSILGCLLSPSSGELAIDGQSVSFRSQA